MRRATAILAAAAVGVGALAGCGEKDEPSTTGPVVPAETTSPATPTTTSTTTADDQTGASTPNAQAATPSSASQSVLAFLTSPDAEAVCDGVLTPAFLRTAYGDRAGCLAARSPDSLADPDPVLEVGPASNAGTRVDAEPAGGVYDGQKLQITVIQQGDAYLIDAVESDAPVGP